MDSNSEKKIDRVWNNSLLWGFQITGFSYRDPLDEHDFMLAVIYDGDGNLLEIKEVGL